MKKLKKILFIIPCMLVVIFASTVNVHAYSNFKMNSYNVNMNVEENGVIHITESIDMEFFTPSHGLYSEIPIKYKMDFGNGENIYLFPVKNVNVKEHQFDTEYGFDNVVVKVGDPDYEFTGKQSYVMTYDIYTKDLNLDGLQMLYMNIIPTNIDGDIHNVTFTINMPKEFDTSKINFTSGVYGTENPNNSNVQYKVNDNTISGKYNGYLQPKEGITIKLDLDYNYFNYPIPKDYSPIAAIIFGVLGLLLLWLYIAKGRDKIIPIVSFQPPKDLNSAEIGYVIDGNVKNKDITSLVIEWATKGYLTIHDKGKKSFELNKVKDADNNLKRYEKVLFNKIFFKDEVSLEDLKDNYIGDDFQKASTELTNSFNTSENRIFAGISGGLKFFAFTLLFISLMTMSYIHEYQQSSMVFYSLMSGLIVTIIIILLFIPWLILGKYKHVMKKSSKIIFYIIFGFVDTIAILVFFTNFIIPSNTNIAVLTFIVIVYLFISASPTKRSINGKAWLEEILGFKDFIKYAEKDRLEKLAHDDPTYFYHVLPYAYVLGVSNLWAKKFDDLAVPKPTWYYGGNSGTFSTLIWINHFNNSMRSLESTSNHITPDDNSSGSGGFGSGGSSGGGFSGGGFGGGSRGSW